MAADRNHTRLAVGDRVRIIPGMALKRDRKSPIDTGQIIAINGEYVMVRTILCDAERYGCELWRLNDGDPGKDIF